MMRLLEILIFYFFLKIKNLSDYLDLSEFRQANKTFQRFIIFLLFFFCYPFYI